MTEQQQKLYPNYVTYGTALPWLGMTVRILKTQAYHGTCGRALQGHLIQGLQTEMAVRPGGNITERIRLSVIQSRSVGRAPPWSMHGHHFTAAHT